MSGPGLDLGPDKLRMAAAISLSRIEGRDLSCVRGERVIFRGLNFSVAAGSLLTLEGHVRTTIMGKAISSKANGK